MVEAIEIVKQVYSVTGKLPKTEQFGITLQMRRAAVSIVSNIAEGVSRKSQIEFARFLEIALGSCLNLRLN